MTVLRKLTSIRIFIAALFALTIFSVGAADSHAAAVKTPHVEAELIAATTAIVPGEPLQVALRLKIIDHWHTYWRNPGDSGLPTKLKWKLPDGFSAGEIEWPHPIKLPLGPLMNFGYEGEVLHLVTVQTPKTLKVGAPVVLAAKADWLVCSDVCIPEDATLQLSLPVVAAKASIDKRWEAAFAAAKSMLPAQSLSDVKVSASGKTLTFSGAATSLSSGMSLNFFPYVSELIANAEKQVFSVADGQFQLKVALAEPATAELKEIEGVFVAEPASARFAAPLSARSVSVKASVVFDKSAKSSSGGHSQAKMPETPLSALSLISAIGFAFLGGLILNLMPCVFPVLGIKVMAFVQNAGHDVGILRRQGLMFALGVLLSFWLLAGLMLALRTAGESIGWGFQLQEPAFVVVLAILFFLMALNLAGVFEIGTSVQTVAGDAEMRAQKGALSGAFASGVLATVVATPCMAPGLGASVGFTLGQSTIVALVVFSAIALGLALPVVLLSFFPAWLKRLPRPGAWMETFKQLMAFPLFATSVWLTWVLGSQLGNDAVARLLFGCVLIAVAAWLYGRLQARRFAFAVIAALLVGGFGVTMAWPSGDTANSTTGKSADAEWIPFSPAKIAELRAQGKGVFVDFTATWCITCQVNKRSSLNQAEVIKKFQTLNVVRMQADWTRKDAVITEALAGFGRNGVPLYVFYPPKGEAVILPEVLTPAIVLEAVEKSLATGKSAN